MLAYLFAVTVHLFLRFFDDDGRLAQSLLQRANIAQCLLLLPNRSESPRSGISLRNSPDFVVELLLVRVDLRLASDHSGLQ